MLKEKSVGADVLWGLRQICRNDPDSELEMFIEAMKRKLQRPHYIPGVFPDAPRILLPEKSGAGIGRFFLYVRAPFGQPEERALSYLNDFFSEKQSGYILTHQFFCLLWAEQGGLALSSELVGKKEELLERIYSEQLTSDPADSLDLYMERAAIVVMYGSVKMKKDEAVLSWVKNIAEMQLSDGAWPLSKTRISYDGASTLLTSPRPHTTVLAMMVLKTYLGTKH
jgi:hypothetical protein